MEKLDKLLSEDEKKEIPMEEEELLKKKSKGGRWEDVEFDGVKDKFTVSMYSGYNSQEEVQWVLFQFENQTTKKRFVQIYETFKLRETVNKQIARTGYRIPAELVLKMIAKSFVGGDSFIKKRFRIGLLPDMRQAQDAARQLAGYGRKIPPAVNLPDKINTNYCLLFVFNFSYPPTITYNYCFILEDESKVDVDKVFNAQPVTMGDFVFLMKVTEIQQKQIDELRKETKTITINLTLENGWKDFKTNDKATAVKIGNVVYLHGSVIDGTRPSAIATLPKEFRPKQSQNFKEQRDMIIQTDGIIKGGARLVIMRLDCIVYVIE